MGLPSTKSGSSHFRAGRSRLHCTGKISSLYNIAGRRRAAAAVSEHRDRNVRFSRLHSSAPPSEGAGAVGRTAQPRPGRASPAGPGYPGSWGAYFWPMVPPTPARPAHFAAPRGTPPRLRSGAAGGHRTLVAPSTARGRPKAALVSAPRYAAGNQAKYAPAQPSVGKSSIHIAGNHKGPCALRRELPDRFSP